MVGGPVLGERRGADVGTQWKGSLVFPGTESGVGPQEDNVRGPEFGER